MDCRKLYWKLNVYTTQIMIEITILNSEFETDSTTIIPTIQDAYVVDGTGYINAYIAFSATTVCSIDLSYDDSYAGYVTPKVVKLTNPGNINNLHALRLTMDKRNTVERVSNFTMTINCCSGLLSKTTSFSITQKACLCTVIFDWGIYEHSDYVTYGIGEQISSDDISLTLLDLVEDGYGWDGKFYYDEEFTREVNFGSDTVSSDITIYANVYRVIRFNVLDGKTQDPLDGVDITINDSPAAFVNCPEYTVYTYVIVAPYESTSQTFTIVASKEDYIDGGGDDYSLNRLDTGFLVLERVPEDGVFYITSQWNPPIEERTSCVDFDSYLQIFDSNMNPINEDNVDGYTTELAHLYYSSHHECHEDEYGDDTCEVDRGWAENSGYDVWISGGTSAYAAIKVDNIFYELDYDYTGGTRREPIEHISGKVNLDSDNRIYRFILTDCSGCGKMYEYGTKVSVTFGGVTYPFEIPRGRYGVWTVFDIKKVNGEWIVETINTFNNFGNDRPNWFVGCERDPR